MILNINIEQSSIIYPSKPRNPISRPETFLPGGATWCQVVKPPFPIHWLLAGSFLQVGLQEPRLKHAFQSNISDTIARISRQDPTFQ